MRVRYVGIGDAGIVLGWLLTCGGRLSYSSTGTDTDIGRGRSGKVVRGGDFKHSSQFSGTPNYVVHHLDSGIIPNYQPFIKRLRIVIDTVTHAQSSRRLKCAIRMTKSS